MMWPRETRSGWDQLLRASVASSLAWQTMLLETYRSLMVPLAEPRRTSPRHMPAVAPAQVAHQSRPEEQQSTPRRSSMYGAMDADELAEVAAFHRARGAYLTAWRDLDDAAEVPQPELGAIHERATTPITWTEELPEVGRSATTTRTFHKEDVAQFARLSGDRNPLHLEPNAWVGTPFTGNLVHGALTASLFSQLLGMELPGPGAVYLSQTLKFQAPVYIGEAVTATVTVTHVRADKRIITLETHAAVTRDGVAVTVLEGEAVVKLLKRREPAA